MGGTDKSEPEKQSLSAILSHLPPCMDSILYSSPRVTAEALRNSDNFGRPCETDLHKRKFTIFQLLIWMAFGRNPQLMRTDLLGGMGFAPTS